MAEQLSFFLSEAEILYNKRVEDDKVKKGAKKGSSTSGSKSSSVVVYNCETCGLAEKCRNPKIKRFGKGKEGILLVGEAPDADEDRRGKLFIGEAGKHLESVLFECGIDMDRDCVRTNVLRCRPSGNPKANQKKSCFSFLEADIKEVAPKLIICLGDDAVRMVLKSKAISGLGDPSSFMKKVHGLVFASAKYNCWIACTFHPKEVIKNSNFDFAFADDITKAITYLDKSVPSTLTMKGNNFVSEVEDIEDILELFSNSKTPVAFDYECNCISAYDEGAQLLTVSLSDSVDEGWCCWLNNPEWTIVEQAFVYHNLKKFILSSAPKVVQHFAMEESWSREHVGAAINNLVMDTMVSSHVVYCRRGTTGLDFQVFRMTGHEYKGMVDVAHLVDEPIEKVADYNCLDSRYTFMAYEHLSGILNAQGNEDLKRFNNFIGSTFVGMANLHVRGMPVDNKVLDEFEETSEKRKNDLIKKIQTSKAGVKYRKKYEDDLNIESPKQLVEFFYDIYNVKVVKKTSHGKKSVDADVLTRIVEKERDQEAKEAALMMLECKKVISFVKKLKEYKGLLDPKGYLHPSYTSNVAETMRSSTFNPNVQNMFKRDKELQKFRKIIIPSDPANYLLEVDQEGMEVRTLAMASKDPELIRQIVLGMEFAKKYPGKPNPWDMHYRWASRMFEKDVNDITKDERFVGKNSFVFATIYGAVPDSIARNTGLDVDHIRSVWDEFWSEYHYVKEWQKKTIQDYKKNGYVSTISGFRRPGPLSIEQICNTPIQGPSFHWVLAGLIKVDEFLVKEKFKTVWRTEIHDSGLYDAVVDEIPDVIKIASKICTAKHFDWQGDVPLSVSWEMGKNFWAMYSVC